MEQTHWDDIAGLATVKQSLQEVAILPLIRPDLFTGLRRTQNILLYGPPGTGKTMLVRAVAVESQSHLFVCSAAVVTSKWLGEAEKMVRRLFQIAHEIAPAIIFIDEIDALLSSRKSDGSGGEHEASRRLKTEFMVQMDGLATQTTTSPTTAGGGGQVLIVGCTNTPWDVDSAVLRRLQRRIFVPLPDDDAREALIRNLLNRAGKHSITSSRQIATLVKRTHGFSCSDISAMAAEASFGPLRELGGLSAMKNVSASAVRPVQLRDFETVLDSATKSVNETQLRKYDQWQSDQAAT
jgi:fidgetin-like protein 1